MEGCDCSERLAMISALRAKLAASAVPCPTNAEIQDSKTQIQALFDICGSNFRLQSWMLNLLSGCPSANDYTGWSAGTSCPQGLILSDVQS